MEIPRIHVHDDGVQTIGADQVFNIGTNQVFIRDIPRWLVDHPKTSIPQAPPATVIIGNPIIDMPGCVETHEFKTARPGTPKDAGSRRPSGRGRAATCQCCARRGCAV